MDFRNIRLEVLLYRSCIGDSPGNGRYCSVEVMGVDSGVRDLCEFAINEMLEAHGSPPRKEATKIVLDALSNYGLGDTPVIFRYGFKESIPFPGEAGQECHLNL